MDNAHNNIFDSNHRAYDAENLVALNKLVTTTWVAYNQIDLQDLEMTHVAERVELINSARIAQPIKKNIEKRYPKKKTDKR